jgi:hypothetical protein
MQWLLCSAVAAMFLVCLPPAASAQYCVNGVCYASPSAGVYVGEPVVTSYSVEVSPPVQVAEGWAYNGQPSYRTGGHYRTQQRTYSDPYRSRSVTRTYGYGNGGYSRYYSRSNTRGNYRGVGCGCGNPDCDCGPDCDCPGRRR